MTVAILASIINSLSADATILSYLGGDYVFRAKTTAPEQIPSITVKINNERSTPRPGYITTKKRDNYPTAQVDIWVSDAGDSFPHSGDDIDTIEGRIDEILLDASAPPAGTLAGTWEKESSTQDHEDETGIWHNALRYTFQYALSD